MALTIALMEDEMARVVTWISLRAANGNWMCAEGGGGREVVANRRVADTWERFGLIALGHHKVALRADNDDFVCAEGGGGGKVVANRKAIGPWETFALIDLGNGQVALQASNGMYVCAERGGGHEVVANRTAIGPWETFSVVRFQHVIDEPERSEDGRVDPDERIDPDLARIVDGFPPHDRP